TSGVTVQTNPTLSLAEPSWALSVTWYGLLACADSPTVPVISPVLGFWLSPAGRPLALYVGVPPTSVRLGCSETVLPSLFCWSAGMPRASLATLQVRPCVALWLPSAALSVTLLVAAVVSVPVISPVLAFRLSPAGKFETLYV